MEMAPLAVSGNVQRASFWVRSRKSSISCSETTHLICFTFVLAGPEEGSEVHDEGEHGVEQADDQLDQPTYPNLS